MRVASSPLRLLSALALMWAAGAAHAQVTVGDPWVRATVAQQKATGMFAQVTSAQGGKLVAASSPVAAVVEIHEMAMENNVMKMRAVPGLELPAGKAVDLKPGGYHVMIMGLKQALPEGSTLPLTLTFTDAQGRAGEVTLRVPVRSMQASGHSHGAH